MCEEETFNFTEFNLDFLELPPAASHVQFELPASTVDDNCSTLQIQSADSQQYVSLPQKHDLSALAKRIAHTDELVKQIKQLQNERNELIQRLEDFQRSADQIQALYATEKEELAELKVKAEYQLLRSEQLDEELANLRLKYDQLEAQWEENSGPVKYVKLAAQFLKLANRLDDENMLHRKERSLVLDITSYCEAKNLHVPTKKISPKKTRIVKVEASVQCELLVSVSKVPTASKGTQHDNRKEMRSQSTQHYHVTTTRGTSTSGLLQHCSVGTSFPERALLPPLSEILLEMQRWNILSPISPIAELPSPPASPQVAETVPAPPVLKTVGTCTFLCNTRRAIDYLSPMPTVKLSTSRPPSRLMCDGIKNEAPSPDLHHSSFEDLWKVFGQKLAGLLQQPCHTAECHPARAPTDSTAQLDFYNLMRGLCVPTEERPLSPLDLTAVAPRELVMRPQARCEPVFPEANEDRASPMAAYDALGPRLVSVATSPIRVLSHSCSHNESGTANDTHGPKNLQRIHVRKEYTSSAFQPQQRINPRRDGRSSPKRRKERQKVAKKTRVLFPKRQTSKSNRIVVTNILKRPSEPSGKVESEQNASGQTTRVCSPIPVDFCTSLISSDENSMEHAEQHAQSEGTGIRDAEHMTPNVEVMHELFGSDTESSNETVITVDSPFGCSTDFTDESSKLTEIDELQTDEEATTEAENDELAKKTEDILDVNRCESDVEVVATQAIIYAQKKAQPENRIALEANSESCDSGEFIGFADADDNRKVWTDDAHPINKDLPVAARASLLTRELEISTFAGKLCEVMRSSPRNIGSKPASMLSGPCTTQQDGGDSVVSKLKNRAQKRKLVVTPQNECVEKSAAINNVLEVAARIDEVPTSYTPTRTDTMMIANRGGAQSASKDCLPISTLPGPTPKKRGRPRRSPIVTAPVVDSPLLDVGAANSSPLSMSVAGPKRRGRSRLSNSENEELAANTSNEAAPEGLSEGNIRLVVNSVPVAKKCGRKPKSQVQARVVATPPAGCKRSERLRAKLTSPEQLEGPSLGSPVSELTRRCSSAQNSPTEHTFTSFEDEDAKTDGFSSDDDRPLYICMDAGSAEVENDCDMGDTTPGEHPTLAQTNLQRHEEHSVVSSGLSAVSFATKSPARTAIASETICPSVCTNQSEAQETLPLNPAKEDICEDPAPFTFTESPASPPPSAEPESIAAPVEIPLELPRGYGQTTSGALLQTLVATHKVKEYRTVNGICNAKKRKSQRALETQLIARITKYLEFAVVNHEAEAFILVQTLEKECNSHETIIEALVQAIQKAPRLSGAPRECRAAVDGYLERVGTAHQRICFVLRHLQAHWPKCIDELLRAIDAVLFKLRGKKEPALPLDEAVNLTQLFIVVTSYANLQLPYERGHPARLFLYKCLYFHQDVALPMVYELLCAFPTVLPCRDDRTYNRSDPLITVIQHRLMCTTYDMTRDDLYSKELLSKLRFEYHYTPFSPDLRMVLPNLLDKLRAGKVQNLGYAMALLCKRLPVLKTQEIVQSELIPIANEYYSLVLKSEAYDERTAALLDCMSMVVKPLPLETDISSLLCIFSRFLNAVERRTLQEAAVHAILRLQRFSSEKCYHALRSFAPNYDLHAQTRLMLRSFVHRKPAHFWRELDA